MLLHAPTTPCRVLLVVEDPAFEDVLVEALTDAGHVVEVATPAELERGEIDGEQIDVGIVDLDTRARAGAAAIRRLQTLAPRVGVIAIFPCGGRPAEPGVVPCRFALEKPVRIHALLAAVQAVGRRPQGR